LNGLSSLSDFKWSFGSLIIKNNTALENIDGLSVLTTTSSDLDALTVIVTKNPSLRRCCGLFPFFQSMGDAIGLARIEIAENGSECTLEDIMADGPCPQSISSFSLINERTGEVIQDFYGSITLNRADPDFFKWTIQANAFPDTVGSVSFRIDKKFKQTENVFPYILKKQFLQNLKEGTYTLTTEVYSKRNEKGEKGVGRTAIINVINSTAILNFDIVDTSGKVLMNLGDGDKINIKDPLLKSFSIRANTDPANVGSVKFVLNHKKFRIENQVPYTLNGDHAGYVNPWRPRVGNYTLEAVPYSRKGGNGTAGEPLKIRFKVVEEARQTEINVASMTRQENSEVQREEISLSLFPIPVENELFVRLNDHAGNNIHITVRNIKGEVVYTRAYSSEQLETSSIKTSGWQPGLYYMQVLGSGFGKVIKFIKK
jgi:hypothetical protein